jgi:putative Ca2+/H+ antiporter (TMEM165/GDT1 family)
MLSRERTVARLHPKRTRLSACTHHFSVPAVRFDQPAPSAGAQVSAFLISFSLIFFAELGDKSQLVALWFATRYRWWLVILGVSAATLVVHLGSTAIGATAAGLLPEPALLAIVGLSFFVFAWWSLRGDSLDEDASPAGASRLGTFGLITTAFFLSELGDKTQLATITIASDHSQFVAVWLGSTAGMVTADALAIAAGAVAGRRLPLRTMSIIAALLFAAFGAFALARASLLLV